MNYIEYEREKQSDNKRIMSMYFDKEHINYARSADFFITNDNKLKNRASLIYSKIYIRTIVCNLRQFLYCVAIKKATGIFPDINHGMREPELRALSKQIIPPVLKDYYLVLGKHPINSKNNIIFSPDKLITIDVYLCFMSAEDEVCYWGIKEEDFKQPDPIVWQLNTDCQRKLLTVTSTTQIFTLFIYNYLNSLNGK